MFHIRNERERVNIVGPRIPKKGLPILVFYVENPAKYAPLLQILTTRQVLRFPETSQQNCLVASLSLGYPAW
jgi:hypothetical protein